jgi:nucleotide-binding universal stress UspA family protein
MLNVIVPLDFSQTSFNAAHYAAQMYKGKTDVMIILYHFYNDDEDPAVAKNYLNSQKEELGRIVNNIDIELESGDNFIDSLAAFAHVKGAFMIVMGLTGKTPREQRFSGSNTLKLSEKEVCPVLIVPEDATYTGINNALITSELKSVEDTPTLLCIKKILKYFKPALHILNINSNHYISVTDDVREERNRMESLLAEFNPEFYFMRLYDFHESVEVFTMDKKIDLIIIAPRYHNFFERLFKTQHTKKLIYHTKVPVLAVHE